MNPSLSRMVYLLLLLLGAVTSLGLIAHVEYLNHALENANKSLNEQVVVLSAELKAKDREIVGLRTSIDDDRRKLRAGEVALQQLSGDAGLTADLPACIQRVRSYGGILAQLISGQMTIDQLREAAKPKPPPQAAPRPPGSQCVHVESRGRKYTQCF
jgi:hypothetical protein